MAAGWARPARLPCLPGARAVGGPRCCRAPGCPRRRGQAASVAACRFATTGAATCHRVEAGAGADRLQSIGPDTALHCGGHTTVGCDEERRRDGGNEVAVGDLVMRINDDGPIGVRRSQKGPARIDAVVVHDPENGELIGLMDCGKPCQLRCLSATCRAPRREEVHDDPAAPVVAEAHLRAVPVHAVHVGGLVRRRAARREGATEAAPVTDEHEESDNDVGGKQYEHDSAATPGRPRGFSPVPDLAGIGATPARHGAGTRARPRSVPLTCPEVCRVGEHSPAGERVESRLRTSHLRREPRLSSDGHDDAVVAGGARRMRRHARRQLDCAGAVGGPHTQRMDTG